MTLAIGNHVVKLDAQGKPLTTDREVYIEYEIEALSPYYEGNDGESRVFAILKKMK